MENILLSVNNKVLLIEERTAENTPNYRVDVSDNSVGMTLLSTNNKNEAETFFEKEVLYEKIEETDKEILSKLNEVNSLFGNVIIKDEEIIGRSKDVIDYFKNELDFIDEFYPDPEDDENKEFFKENATETMVALRKNTKPNEPVVLHIHPMSSWYELLDSKQSKEILKGITEDILEVEEQKEELSNSDITYEKMLDGDYSHLQKGIIEEIIFQAEQMAEGGIFDTNNLNTKNTEKILNKVLKNEYLWEIVNDTITSNLKDLQQEKENEEEM